MITLEQALGLTDLLDVATWCVPMWGLRHPDLGELLTLEDVVLASRTGNLAARDDLLRGLARMGPVIAVPSPTSIGLAKVAAGFPHTPEGAIGQLASIEVSVLSQMSIAGTHEVYQVWTASGAAPVEQWRLMRHVQAFLGTANMGQTKDPRSIVTITPVAAR